MTAMIEPMKRNLLAPRFFVPLTLLAWLLTSLTFMLLIPRADAQAGGVCPSKWGDEPGSPTMTENGTTAPASGALRDVYNAVRLTGGGGQYKFNICQGASGTVTYVEPWSDGDWDIYVKLDPEYLPGGSSPLVTSQDIKDLRYFRQARKTKKHQAADMLWEVVPGDQGTTCGDGSQIFDSGKGILEPSYTRHSGDKVQVVGAWDYDSNHGYRELHRVYQVKDTTKGATCAAALNP